MYWCKSKPFITVALIGCITIGGIGCKPDAADKNASLTYFDIKGYFIADTIRLKKLDKPVTKTVTHNGVTETKKVKVDNWGQELDMFMGADINRPAWKNSYTILNGDKIILYKAKDEDLKVREISIKKENGKVKWILIFTRTQNILYKTTEKL